MKRAMLSALLCMGAAIPQWAVAALAVLAVLATFLAHARARDSVQDCATFGPHSVGCRRGIENRDDPARIEDELRRAKQDQRNRAPAQHVR